MSYARIPPSSARLEQLRGTIAELASPTCRSAAGMQIIEYSMVDRRAHAFLSVEVRLALVFRPYHAILSRSAA